MEISRELTRFKNNSEQRTVVSGGQQTFNFMIKDGVDFMKIRHVKTTCGCANASVYRDRVSVDYYNDGQQKADIEFVEKYIYVFFEIEGLPENQQPPLEVVNSRGVSDLNYNDVPWELLTIKARVVKQ